MIEHKNPISIKLMEKGQYKISLKLDNWEVSKIVSEKVLNDLLLEIKQ